MSIEAMKQMKTNIMHCVEGQMDNLKDVNTKQLGEAIDMIKDLSEAIYYCTITQSMQKAEEEKPEVRNINYYTPMYYPGGGQGGNGGGTRYYTPRMPDEYMNYGMMPDDGYYRRWQIAERNPKEGRSPVRRRMYMEGKEQHKDMPSQMHELEAYLQELSSDVTEMMKDASPEEKNTLRQKLNMLTNKIV